MSSNFVVSITFPPLIGAFTPQGAFGWYAAWNAIGFVLVLLFVPETKQISLEELDQGSSRARASIFNLEVADMRGWVQCSLCQRVYTRPTSSRRFHGTSSDTSFGGMSRRCRPCTSTSARRRLEVNSPPGLRRLSNSGGRFVHVVSPTRRSTRAKARSLSLASNVEVYRSISFVFID